MHEPGTLSSRPCSQEPKHILRTNSVFCIVIFLGLEVLLFLGMFLSILVQVASTRYSRSSILKRDEATARNFPASDGAFGRPSSSAGERGGGLGRAASCLLVLKHSPGSSRGRLASLALIVDQYIGFADRLMYFYAFKWPIHSPIIYIVVRYVHDQ